MRRPFPLTRSGVGSAVGGKRLIEEQGGPGAFAIASRMRWSPAAIGGHLHRLGEGHSTGTRTRVAMGMAGLLIFGSR